ncbi:MAG: aminotransferase DegT [Spirochaetes bacterium GWF1_41_5]|nr:MAG: aminotransferase DegT [Spirochaetes bacterium GWF1_41_5]HBE04572.1 aminotransferase DegT [Spirochaetia bacterium]
MNSIPLSVPNLNGKELEYVTECIKTGWISSAGKFVERFEIDTAKYTGAGYAVAAVNGTCALFIALKEMGIGPGDEVIVPALTFIAPVNAVHYTGAAPVFMDCDDLFCMDMKKLSSFFNEETEMRNNRCFNRNTGKPVKAVIPVHVFGNACDLETLTDLCAGKNILILEDATESLGTRYTQGKFAGKSPGCIGKAGVLSFNGNKIITAGGGGMILTDDKKLAERLKYLTTQAKEPGPEYIHHEAGYNFRLTNLAAALGAAQLEQLDEFILHKKNNYLLYQKLLSEIPGCTLCPVNSNASVNYWFYALKLEKSFGMDAMELVRFLQERQIESRPIWRLNHLQKPYLEAQSYMIEKAPVLQKAIVNLPCSSNLSEKEVERVCACIKEAGKIS